MIRYMLLIVNYILYLLLYFLYEYYLLHLQHCSANLVTRAKNAGCILHNMGLTRLLFGRVETLFRSE